MIIAIPETFVTWNRDLHIKWSTEKTVMTDEHQKMKTKTYTLNKTLTTKPNLRFPRLLPLIGSSVPSLTSREFKTSRDELRTGSEKYKYTFKLSCLFVACTSLVSLLSWSSLSGTRVFRLASSFLLSIKFKILCYNCNRIQKWEMMINQ